MNVKDGQFLVALENVEPPFGLGFPRLARLAVLDQDTVDQVGVLQDLVLRELVDREPCKLPGVEKVIEYSVTYQGGTKR